MTTGFPPARSLPTPCHCGGSTALTPDATRECRESQVRTLLRAAGRSGVLQGTATADSIRLVVYRRADGAEQLAQHAVQRAAFIARQLLQQSRLIALRPLDAWGDVWHALTRLQDETERFALDKRQAIVAGLGMLSGKMS